MREIIEIMGDCASVVIAVLALVVSIRTLKLEKKHNELSLMPVCEMFTTNYDDSLSVEIYNKGLGLLEIVSSKFVNIDGKKYDNLHDLVRDEDGLSYVTIPPKKVLMSGEKVVLVEFLNVTVEQRKRVLTKLSNVMIDIEYRDVYDNRYRFRWPISFE